MRQNMFPVRALPRAGQPLWELTALSIPPQFTKGRKEEEEWKGLRREREWKGEERAGK